MIALLFAVSLAASRIDPQEIFARARAVAGEHAYPAFLRYRVAVDVMEAGKERVERYDSAYDVANDSLWVEPVSDWEEQHHADGRGVNFGFHLFGADVEITKPEPPVDFIGVPLLSPTYNFGLSYYPRVARVEDNTAQTVEAVRAAFHDPARAPSAVAPSPRPTPLKEIVVTSASDLPYEIRFVGIENVRGHSCFHLNLRALKDPWWHRLHDVWIDQSTFEVWRERVSENFSNRAGSQSSWLVDFADQAGKHYIHDETAEGAVRRDGLIFTHVRVSFEHVVAAKDPVTWPLFLPRSPDDLAVEPDPRQRP